MPRLTTPSEQAWQDCSFMAVTTGRTFSVSVAGKRAPLGLPASSRPYTNSWVLGLSLSLLDFLVMASSLKSRRGPMGPLFATDRYCDFDPVDRVVYTWPWKYILLVYIQVAPCDLVITAYQTNDHHSIKINTYIYC